MSHEIVEFRREADARDKWILVADPAVDRRTVGLAQASNLPVEQPVSFDLVINMKSAQALGIAIPESILVRADKVIE
jgi:hypothetical protein